MCRGTDYEQPFECPLDFMLAPHALQDQGVQYRPAGFLQLPQVGAVLRCAVLGWAELCGGLAMCASHCLLWFGEHSAHSV